MIKSRLICSAAKGIVSSFPWLIFHSVHVQLLLCPFICRWTFWLHLCLAILSITAVHVWVPVSFWILVFSGYRPISGSAGSYGSSIVTFSRHLHSVLISGCYQFTTQQQQRRVHILGNAFSIYGLQTFFSDGHSDYCEVIPFCSLKLHVSKNSWCWALFHVPLKKKKKNTVRKFTCWNCLLESLPGFEY